MGRTSYLVNFSGSTCGVCGLTQRECSLSLAQAGTEETLSFAGILVARDAGRGCLLVFLVVYRASYL